MERKVSIYSDLSTDELLRQHHLDTFKYGKLLFNNNVPPEKRKLINLITANPYILNPEIERFQICERGKELLYRSAFDLSVLIFKVIESKQDYGIHGRDRVYFSFLRSTLSIPTNERYIKYSHKKLFENVIEDIDKKHGSKSIDYYIEFIKNFKITLFGIDFPIADTDKFVELRFLLDSDWFFWTSYSQYPRFILGEMSTLTVDNISIPLMTHEYIRSPQWIVNIVAEVFKDSTIIRRYSYEVIFNKWISHLDEKTKIEQYQISRNANLLMGEGLKKMTLLNLNVYNVSDLLSIKEKLINEQIILTYKHEQGHHLSYKDMMDPVNFHFAINNDDRVGSVLIETLADWKCSISYLINLSRKNNDLAVAMMYNYMADYWYCEDIEDSDYMSLHSDIQVGLPISFVKKNGKIDWEKLAAEQEKIDKFLLLKYNQLVEKLINFIQSSLFDLGNGKKPINFSKLEKYELKEQKEKSNGKINTLDDLRQSSSYWENMQGHLEQYNPSRFSQYNQIILELGIQLERDVLELVGGNKEFKTLREYIIDRAKECGIIQMKPEIIDAWSVIFQACEEIKHSVYPLSEEDIEMIIGQFQNIINGGEPFEIIENNHSYGDHSLFVMVVQKLLQMGNDQHISGEIPFFLDDHDEWNLLETETQKLSYLKSFVVDYIFEDINDNCFFQKINIKVNSKFKDLIPLLKKLLDIKLDHGKLLSDRVNSIYSEKMESDDLLLEYVYNQPCWGFICHNTYLSLFFIIMELTKNDYEQDLVINKTVIDYLIYNAYKNSKPYIDIDFDKIIEQCIKERIENGSANNKTYQ